MKYINFKRYKFSTIVKKLNALRYSFFGIFKFIDPKSYNFRRLYRYLSFGRLYRHLSFGRLYRHLSFGRLYRYLSFGRLYRYLDFRRYNFYRVDKKIKLKSFKYLLTYFIACAIFIGFVYLAIPTFYSYDKIKIEEAICKNQNIECSIRGKINYSFYPTPRIKIKDLVINDFFKKKNILITAEKVVVKLSIGNLLIKKKQNFKKIELSDFKIIVDLKNLKKYKSVIIKKINIIPATFTKGKIVLFDENNYVATIHDTNLNLILEEDTKKAVLKGKFLNDNIYISLNNKKIDDKASTDIILKISDLNLLSKASFFNSEKNKNTINGNILIKKGKHRFTGIFNYKNNEITINKSNLRNIFLDGKLEGKIKILPYFNFNLDLNLNSVNLTSLHNHFLALDKEDQRNLFKINKKINGKLNLSSDKIYSSYNLVKSFESRIKFNNGDILVEQFLISLGKLGAADILGTINGNKKFTNFKYESNIFVDNQKKFLNKFDIYNKKSIPSNLFVSGNFDLQNIRSSFYEISNDEKFSNEDVNFIEQEFNDFMLIDGYESLFRFPKFKEFVKSITSEVN